MPNYTARRVGVGAVAVAVIVAAVVVIVMMLGDEDSEELTAVEPGWDAIVEIDRTNGTLTALDPDGDEILTIEGTGRAAAVHTRGDRLAVVGTGQVTLTAVDDDDDPTVVEFDRSSRVARHPSDRSFTLVVAPEIGGEILVIDADSGLTTALGERAAQTQPLLLPETLRADRAGQRFAVGDGRNFQTIVIDVDDSVDPTFFPGVPMSLDADIVVTSTNVGGNAELGFFAVDGTRAGLVATPRPVAGVLDGEQFVFVTEDGRLLSASPGDDEPTEIADLGLATVDMVVPVLDRSRLAVIAPRRLLVIDLEGTTLHDHELAPGDPVLDGLTPWTTWECLPVMRSGGGTLVDLRDGAVRDELPAGRLQSVTPDGCGVHLRVDPPSDDADADADDSAGAASDATDLIVTAAGRYTPRGPVREVVLAADGTAALVVMADGNVELVTVDDGRRLDLGVRRGLLAFAQR